jgi:acyl dehydratase
MTSSTDRPVELEPIDTTDVERWVGRPVGGEQMREPVGATDIRRWVQALQNPNPLHYDHDFATEGVFGGLVAPQSFTVATSPGQGARPAVQGTIPGSHMLFGGDEWWFLEPRIRPGDRLVSERFCFDCKLAQTRFAGPTVFQRGDTTYINQRGEIVARQRSTAVRYLVANARRLRAPGVAAQSEWPQWSDEQIADLDQLRLDYFGALWTHRPRVLSSVQAGETLPRRPVGPHSLQSFTTEYRAHLSNAWGSTYLDGLPQTLDSGWLPEMQRNREKARIDPIHTDGLYRGASRGHTDPRYASLIGMERPYGYGASMGAWMLDHAANWAGEHGRVVHAALQYRAPALAGDLTWCDATVREVGDGAVLLDSRLSSQTGVAIATGTIEVLLPRG